MVYLGLHQRLRGHGVLDQRPARAGQVRPLAQHLPERPSSGLAVPKPEQVAGLLSVAAGSGYWRDNAPQLKRIVPYFWWVLVPLATRLCGYFPGRTLKKVGDLPAGVILQWRRWCLDPAYSVGAEGPAVAQSYGAVRFPVLALSMSDDELMTLRGTHNLVNLYANTERRVESISPVELKVRRIGHFGFFRDQFRQSLWPRAVAALAQLGGGAVVGTPVAGTTL